MQQITKFRGYNPNSNKMVYYTWEDIVFVMAGAWFQTPENDRRAKMIIDLIKHNRTVTAQMLFCGIQDKSKTDMYELDIVKYRYYDKEEDTVEEGRGYIVFASHEAGFRLVVKNKISGGPDEEIPFWNDPDVWTLEIVGDMVRNPKVLNK